MRFDWKLFFTLEKDILNRPIKYCGDSFLVPSLLSRQERLDDTAGWRRQSLILRGAKQSWFFIRSSRDSHFSPLDLHHHRSIGLHSAGCAALSHEYDESRGSSCIDLIRERISALLTLTGFNAALQSTDRHTAYAGELRNEYRSTRSYVILRYHCLAKKRILSQDQLGT